ncbi:MAG: homocysteine S-methyltransferase family protein [Amaricoccus sp.]
METALEAKYRRALPQMGDRLFISDGGMETTLIFQQGIDLPHFAAVVLLRTAEGRAALARYFAPYLEIARRDGRGLVLDTPTWRASPDWAVPLGCTVEALDDANRQAVAFVRAIRDAEETPATPIVVDGVIGPRGDGYRPSSLMTAAEAEAYHARQVDVLADAGADMLSALTMTYADEAIGIARAARAASIPVVLSFTVETDGRLRSGMTVVEAVAACDAATDAYPAYYMLNCAHPTHFRDQLVDGGWRRRIGGIRANASKASHAEIDDSPVLDDGDPAELAAEYRVLAEMLPALRVLGGCCGTDHRHVSAISDACGHRHAA